MLALYLSISLIHVLRCQQIPSQIGMTTSNMKRRLDHQDFGDKGRIIIENIKVEDNVRL